METEEVCRKIFTFSLNIHVPLFILAVLGMVLIKVISNVDWLLGLHFRPTLDSTLRIVGVNYPLLSFQGFVNSVTWLLEFEH